MSSWVGDWERNLIPGARRGKPGEKDYRTQCKLGGEMMLKGTPAVWLTDPLGLSCQAHAEEVEAAKVAVAELEGAVPA